MKEIEFIVNGDKLERVKRILLAHSKSGIFVTQGDRGVNMLPKVSVRTVVRDELVDAIIDEAVADMGNATFGDGKVFVKNIQDAVRIRTNERGDEAL